MGRKDRYYVKITVQKLPIMLYIAEHYSCNMSKNTETAWKAAQASYVTEVKDGKATVEKIPIRLQGNGPVTSRENYVRSLEGASVLTMLVDICEDPGHTKSAYAGKIRSAYTAIETLKKLRLIEEYRTSDEKYGSLRPTEAGKSLYTGIWYAMHNLPMVAKMDAFDMMTPPAFWTYELFVLRENDKGADYGFYRLVDAEDEKRALTIRDAFVDPDGGLWFTPTGANCRCKIDIEDELETLDEETQRILKKIITESAEAEKERVTEGYKDLMGYTEPPEE